MPSLPEVFQIGFLLVLLWVNRCVFSPSVLLRVLLTLFQCCLSIRPFCYVLLVVIFCSKIVLLSLQLVFGIFLSHPPPVQVGRIFSCCFGISCFVCIVLPRLDIFLISLLSPGLFGLFPRVVLSFLLALLFPFCPKFQHFFFILSSLIIIIIIHLKL